MSIVTSSFFNTSCDLEIPLAQVCLDKRDAKVSLQQGYGGCSEWSPRPSFHQEEGRLASRSPSSVSFALAACVHPMISSVKWRGKESGRAELRVPKRKVTLQSYVCCPLTSKERWKYHLSEFPRRP